MYELMSTRLRKSKDGRPKFTDRQLLIPVNLSKLQNDALTSYALHPGIYLKEPRRGVNFSPIYLRRALASCFNSFDGDACIIIK